MKKESKPKRVKYIEKSPLKRTLIFANSSDFWKFYKEYYYEICDKYCKDTDWATYTEAIKRIWKREWFKITKNGEPTKYCYPKHLMTFKAKEKQRTNWKAYQTKKKWERIGIKEKLKQKEVEIKEFLAKQGYDIKNIEIKAREK